MLSGTVNPSGRLAETVPHRLEDNSSYLNFPGDSRVVRYGEGLFIGYRGYDAVALDVAFPFGFGLSYTTFALADLDVAVSGTVAAGDLSATVTVTVTNTGPVAGAEVVQVYVRDVAASVARPVRELRGFTKVTLDPGESRTVTVTLDQRAFSFWSELLGRWVVEAGEFAVEVGHHSRDLPLTRTVTIDAPSIAAPITPDSSLHEWMADPVALALIKRGRGRRPARPHPRRGAGRRDRHHAHVHARRLRGHERRPRHPRQARRALARESVINALATCAAHVQPRSPTQSLMPAGGAG